MQKTDEPSIPITTPTLYNVCLSGKYGVGKTTLFKHMLQHHGCRTTNVDEFTFTVPRCASKIRLMDTADMERHDSLTGNYYRQCACIVFVYDVTDMDTLRHVNESYRTICERGYCDADTKFVAVRNKVDVCGRDVQIQKDIVPDFLTGNAGRVFETSGKTGHGVVEFFEEGLIDVLEGVDPVAKKNNLMGDADDRPQSCCSG